MIWWIKKKNKLRKKEVKEKMEVKLMLDIHEEKNLYIHILTKDINIICKKNK